MATVSDLVSAVIGEGQFDASQSQALRWLSTRQKTMLSRARLLKRTTSLGSTVAGQRDYALPADLLELLEVDVAGVSDGRANHVDLANAVMGWVLLSGEGGVIGPEEDALGAAEIALFPTPETGGDPITVRGVFRAPDLSLSDDSTLKVPDEFTDALVSGAIATALQRLENRFDLAAQHEQKFESACEELRRQVARQYRGPGPSQIRVIGVNA